MGAGAAACPASAAAITARKRENRIRHNTPITEPVTPQSGTTLT